MIRTVTSTNVSLKILGDWITISDKTPYSGWPCVVWDSEQRRPCIAVWYYDRDTRTSRFEEWSKGSFRVVTAELWLPLPGRNHVDWTHINDNPPVVGQECFVWDVSLKSVRIARWSEYTTVHGVDVRFEYSGEREKYPLVYLWLPLPEPPPSVGWSNG